MRHETTYKRIGPYGTCDTQFAKKRGWSLFFLCFFSLSGGALLGIGNLGGKPHKTVEFMLVVYAGDGSTGM
jgi:hypothetical protein